jgi:phenylpropionate dioxygenase-like ring-hydroxylating dioxygenase large terminal subunit
MYPLNAWYAAAWDHEVGRTLLARTIGGRPIVLYRTLDGRIAALHDACWHRLVPLSMGTLVGDDLVCGYHGVVYGPNGRAVHMPAQETLNPSARVASYPTAQRHRYVWIWLGEAHKADPDLIPDLRWNDDPAWAGDGRTMELDCDYRLVLDNLMDLTHEEFLHADSIGSDSLSLTEPVVEHDDRTVTLTRWMHGIQPPAFQLMQMRRKDPSFSGLVDRWQIIRFEGPCTIAIDVGVAPAGTGAPEGDRSQGISGRVINTITPGEPGKCHYHWAYQRDFCLHDQGLTSLLTNGVARVFLQDKAMLEAQQKTVAASPDYEFFNLNIDAGGMWVRRIIDRMVAAEQGRERSHPTLIAASASATRQASSATSRSSSRRGRSPRPASRCSRCARGPGRRGAWRSRPAATSTSACRCTARTTRAPTRSSTSVPTTAAGASPCGWRPTGAAARAGCTAWRPATRSSPAPRSTASRSRRPSGRRCWWRPGSASRRCSGWPARCGHAASTTKCGISVARASRWRSSTTWPRSTPGA